MNLEGSFGIAKAITILKHKSQIKQIYLKEHNNKVEGWNWWIALLGELKLFAYLVWFSLIQKLYYLIQCYDRILINSSFNMIKTKSYFKNMFTKWLIFIIY